MPDETQPPPDAPVETAAPQESAAPAPTNVVTMTVEEFEAKLNARAAETRRALEAKAQKQAESPKPKKTDEPAPGLSTDDVQSMIARNRAFDRAVGDKFNAEQVSILETLMAVEKPLTSEIAEWVARKTKAFGTTSAPNVAQTSAPAQQAQPPAPGTPAPTHPAPAATSTTAPPQSILDWSADQMNAYLRSKGANPANPYSAEYRKVAREIRNRFLADGSQVRVISPK
jgi:hypothetical protein